jgi:pimeloyl-ACP methyl ester carboxylesterase
MERIAPLVPTPDPLEFESDGLRLAGERFPPGERGTVLLLHGGGQTRHSWARTGLRLSHHGWTAIALDARGHGDSQWAPDRDYSLEAFVNDLLTFIATLGEPPVLVGASLGGTTSLVAAGEHPGLARGLVLVDIVAKLEQTGTDRIREFMTARPDGFASLEEVAEAIAAYNPVRRRTRNLEGLKKNVRLGDDGRWRWHWDPAFMAIEDEPQRFADPERVEAAAAALTIPTMIVRGVHSDVVSDEGLAHMLALVPHAQVVEVGAAAHMVAGDDNDVFAARLEAFLDGL